MHVVTKWLRLKSRCTQCKVALHLSYLQIKFNDEIDRGSLDLGLKVWWVVFNFVAPYCEDGAR